MDSAVKDDTSTCCGCSGAYGTRDTSAGYPVMLHLMAFVGAAAFVVTFPPP